MKSEIAERQQGKDEGHGQSTSVAALAATIFGLCGFAIAIPLLTLLGPAATFFTAHGAGRRDVILFTLALLLVPAAVTISLLLLVRYLLPRYLNTSMDLLVGALTAAVVVPGLDKVLALASWSYVLLALALAVAIALLHRRHRNIRTFARLTAAGPIIVAVWFLFFSSASGLVLPRQRVEGARAQRDANVVLVILDELPLAALMDGKGRINSNRFPGFTELSQRSTWYRRATTVAPWTNLAVPAILSGRMPKAQAKANYYARNVFSMLENTHELVPMEFVTRVCQSPACGTESLAGSQIYDDAFILYSHTLLPDDLARSWLPPIQDRWSNFRDKSDLIDKSGSKRDDSVRFQQLLDDIGSRENDGPTAWVAHFRPPHLPFNYLPGGELYDTRKPPGLTPKSASWTQDQATIDLARQRFILQVRYADKFVGRILETLKQNELDKNTLVVVTSDHGLSFSPGSRRGAPYDTQKAPDVMPVPLFVKYPGQELGSIDDRHAQTIDIVPTIADSLDVDLPENWRFDGRSLTGAESVSPRSTRYFDAGPVATPPTFIDPIPATDRYRDLFGDWRGEYDTYAWGPHWQLLGRAVGESDTTHSSARATLLHREILSYDPAATLTPALVEVRFDRDPGTDWFAISVNGRIAGLGRTYSEQQNSLGMAVIDPALLRPGSNKLSGLLIGSDGTLSSFPVAPGP